MLANVASPFASCSQPANSLGFLHKPVGDLNGAALHGFMISPGVVLSLAVLGGGTSPITSSWTFRGLLTRDGAISHRVNEAQMQCV